MKNKILFFGELPHNMVHGISLASKLNIDLLSKKFNIDIVEEKSDLKEHNKKTISKIKKIILKIKKIISSLKKILSLNQKNQYDYFYTIFSLSTFGSIKTLLSLLSFKVNGKGKSILHIHRGDFSYFYNKKILNKFIAKIIFRLIDKLIVLSDGQKKEFSKFYNENNIYVLENSLKKEYTFKEKKIENEKFLYISNYIKEKGIFELLDAFESLEYDNIYLKLECFGEFTSDAEKQKILKYKSDKININGFINSDEKFNKIYSSDCLILPSWNEGQPTIILEAMSQGTIILTTHVGLIEEMLGENYPFYFQPKNQDSLLECIEKFIKYKDKNILSRNLRDLYYHKFSNSIHKEKLLKIF